MNMTGKQTRISMKTSHIMQVYLGEYPGSRSDSDKKFLRAVESFINQNDKDSELIIVSDSCQIVHKLYYEHFKSEPRIKYVFVDKDVPSMYEGTNDGKPYYRGLPRQVGRSLASGEIISYMDSDDFLKEDAVSIIKKYWSHHLKQDDFKWSMTSRWVDNQKAIEFWAPSPSTTTFGETFKIEGLEDLWVECGMTDPSLVMSATFSISHVRDLPVEWVDKIDHPSEDTVFANKMYKTGKGFVIQEPYYVRCHYTKQWDY